MDELSIDTPLIVRRSYAGSEFYLNKQDSLCAIKIAALYAKAAIQDARIDFKTDEASLNWVHFYYSNWFFRIIIQIALWVYPLLTFCEDIQGSHRDWTYLVEIICWSIIAIAFAIRIRFTDSSRLITSRFFFIHSLAIVIILIDLVCSWIWSSQGRPYYRYARMLRPLLQLEYLPHVRRRVVDVLKMISRIKSVLLLIFFHWTFFSILAIYLFYGTKEGNEHFGSVSQAYVSLIILMSTCNSPSVMMPGYTEHWYVALFFVAYLIITIFLVVNLVFAEVYHIHRHLLKESARRGVLRRRVCSYASYMVLQRYIRQDLTREAEFHTGAIGIPLDLVTSVLRTLRMSQVRIEKIFQLVSVQSTSNGDHYITKNGYENIIMLLQLTRAYSPMVNQDDQFLTMPPESWKRWIAGILYHEIRVPFGETGTAYTLNIVVNVLVAVSSILTVILLSTSYHSMLSGHEPQAYSLFINLCSVFFAIEVSARLYVHGVLNYLRDPWNLCDFVVVAGSFLSIFVPTNGSMHNGVILFLRQLRLLRLANFMSQLKILLNTVAHLIPGVSVFARVLFQFYYAYAIVGMGLFGTVRLADQYYEANDFRTFGASLLTLFELMIANDWNVTMKGFYVATDNEFSQLYFIFWYLFGTVIVLNSITSFALEAIDKNIGKREERQNRNFGVGSSSVGSDAATTMSDDPIRMITDDSVSAEQERATLQRMQTMLFKHQKPRRNLMNLMEVVFHDEFEEPTMYDIETEFFRLGLDTQGFHPSQ